MPEKPRWLSVLGRPGLIVVVSVVVGVAALMWLWPTFGPRPARPVAAESHMNLSHIGAALQDYVQSHDGRLPASIDGLVPKYIALSNLVWFFPAYNQDLSVLRASPTSVQRSNLDSNSMYVFLGEVGRVIDCVAFERPDLLQCSSGARTGRITHVNIIGSDLTAKRVDVQGLVSRLNSIGRMQSLPGHEEP